MSHKAIGAVAGAGVEIKVMFFRLSPGVRYTRIWHVNFQAVFSKTNPNQLQLTVGIWC